ncbi:hypothetical protein G6F31_019510 [Rhizopus arrhizus]|nr:hypothetical protein G6F31_019510 [Rhizopus arrhizus]
MSTTELELEIAQAVESNPLLDWADSNDNGATSEGGDGSDGDTAAEPSGNGDDWAPAELDWSAAGSGGSFDDDDDNGSAAERHRGRADRCAGRRWLPAGTAGGHRRNAAAQHPCGPGRDPRRAASHPAFRSGRRGRTHAR